MLTALITGRPPAVVSLVTSNLPTASVVRYGACGLSERQLKRVQPSLEVCDSRTPLLSAWLPSGTETEMSYVALSVGWSLLGNHHTAESGSCAITPPSGVRCQAE